VRRRRVIALAALATLALLIVVIATRLVGRTTDVAVHQGDQGGGRSVALIAPSPTPLPWTGSVIAAVLVEGAEQSIALFDAGGKLPARRLTQGFDSAEAPAWSPDGT
jgi:hypothetical protein